MIDRILNCIGLARRSTALRRMDTWIDRATYSEEREANLKEEFNAALHQRDEWAAKCIRESRIAAEQQATANLQIQAMRDALTAICHRCIEGGVSSDCTASDVRSDAIPSLVDTLVERTFEAGVDVGSEAREERTEADKLKDYNRGFSAGYSKGSDDTRTELTKAANESAAVKPQGRKNARRRRAN